MTLGSSTPLRCFSIQSSCASSMSPGLLCSVSVPEMVGSCAVRSQLLHVLTLVPSPVTVTTHCLAFMVRCCAVRRMRARPPRCALEAESRELRMSTLAAGVPGALYDELIEGCDATARPDWPLMALPAAESCVVLGAGTPPSLEPVGAADMPARADSRCGSAAAMLAWHT